MTKDDEYIWQVSLRHPVRTGIDYGSQLPGCVPEFEEREAAVYCGYTPILFRKLPVWERAKAVAQLRISRMIGAHTEAAIGEAAERLVQANRKG